ncbi:cyanophycin synthetase [Actinoplanes derwentensis]|uniref:Cyanophycin synthetase n=1 Tax=Actinoplanes derwentensis TaxID=113562 RepID=A0A1H2DAA4_9ACTN|nr:cyanophycin synthetase [Actinoplanes derwentensis]GID81654.1 cyanophycin synthetase [Actinoplanes derwentensis]SDT79529.1 cyanophycin synthetase [Actinoplanes derwentensis]
MKIESLRRLRGPNVYLSRPAMVARLHLGGLTGVETTDITGFTERLLRAMPGLAEHHCAAGTPGGFVSRLRGGTYFGHVAEHVCIELSQLIGRDVTFGRTVGTGADGVYDVITECPADESPESPLPGELLTAAIGLVLQVSAGGGPAAPRLAEQLAGLAALAEREATGPSTRSIIEAARRRGIPVERFDDLSLVRLGWGHRRRMAWAAMTDRTSAVGVDIAGDKHVTRRLLDEAGVPVAAGGAAGTEAEAIRLFGRLGGPVVVKPRNGRHGRAVALHLTSAEDVRRVFAAIGGDAVVERQLDGRDYRVLVVAGEVVAAAERVAAHVVGDGRATITELIDRVNADPRRGTGHSRVLTRITVDETVRRVLARDGRTPATVLADGEVARLRDTANLSTGGTSRDVTDQVHPDVTRICRRVAALLGLDIAGIDLRLPDVAAPVPPVAGVTTAGVIEVNAVPGLRMHLAPVEGRPRDVGDAIVRAMFPGGSDGRIPAVAITGTNGKTTVTRLTAHLLSGSGLRVGTATSDGVAIDGRVVQVADATGPRSAQMVLGDPQVEMAVLETARGGLLRRGLGYDWSDVGVITNITADHLGQDGLDSVEDLAHVKAVVAERVRDGGTLVLNADDPWVRSLADRPRVRADHKRLVWFSLDPQNPVLAGHLARGGSAYLLHDGWLVQATGARRTPLLRLAEVPGAYGGAALHVAANTLAAIAAARALGARPETLADRLAEFDPAADNPGRGTLFRLGDVSLYLDYAHNPAALATTLRTLHRLWGPDRCVGAVTLPGDRRADLLAASAQVLADGLTRVVLYEDEDLRGRPRGEVSGLVEREMRARRPRLTAVRTEGFRAALTSALEMAEPGDVVLVIYESWGPLRSFLAGLGAVPAAGVPVHAALPSAGPGAGLQLARRLTGSPARR